MTTTQSAVNPPTKATGIKRAAAQVVRIGLAMGALFSVVGTAQLNNFWWGSAYLATRGGLLVASVLLLLVWRKFGWWSRVLLLVIAGLAAISWGADLTRRPAAPAASTGGLTLKVVTYNALFVNTRADRILAMIRASDADVVLLQEVTPALRAALEPALASLYPAQSWKPASDAWGTAILAKTSLANPLEILDDSGSPFAHCAQLARGSDDVTICSVHLLSPAAAFPIEASPQFMRKLDAVAGVRAEQTERLLREIDAWQNNGRHVIVGGDFNTLEIEPVYRTMRLALVDTYRQKHFGIGATWPHHARRSPFARIDYIFASDHFEVHDVDVLNPAGSDHAPVSAVLKLQRGERPKRGTSPR